MSDAATVNSDQIEFWNGAAADRWLAEQERIDASVGPIGIAAMDRVGVRPADNVVDIGCGCGATTLELTRRVGPRGSVTAVDISTPMLRRAQERAAAAGLGNVVFVNADASTYRFEPGAADLAFSRFGVMFFRNGEQAFANIHGALKPGGRLGFACWRALADNPWVTVPRDVALRHVLPPEPPKPGEPGPFALADAERLRRLLEAAGFSQIAIEPHDTVMRHEGDLDQVAHELSHFGPASRLILEADEAIQETIRADLVREVAPLHDGSGVALGASVWIVSARA